jgi:hypothetical protein
MLMRKLGRDESGATVVIIALMIVVLFAAAALAIDVARMYGERRELQRTADLSAVSGAMQLQKGIGTAQAIGEFYVGQNPTMYHPGPYNPAGGDLVEAQSNCTIEGIDGTIPCVRSTVVAPRFPFLLAPVLGMSERAISAKAVAVLGSGAPGGHTLIPWVLMDCARALYGELPAWDDWNPSCDKDTDGGYKFSADFVDGPFVKLYNTNGDGSNFQAIAFDPEPDCALTYDGLFDHSGAKDYTEFLEGTTGDVTPCTVDKGARLFTKPGNMGTPTDKALDLRNGTGIDGCMNETAFHEAVDVINADTGLIEVKEPNACLVQITLVVHANPDRTNIFTDVPGGCGEGAPTATLLCIDSADDGIYGGTQHPIGTPNPDPNVITRLADFDNGTPQRMVARRFAFFYIMAQGDPKVDTFRYKGLFMKASDSRFSELGGGTCDPLDGICTVKMVYEP